MSAAAPDVPVSVRARPPRQWLPLAGGVAAVLALAVVLGAGPGGRQLPALFLGLCSASLLTAATARRAWTLSRSGQALTVLIGLLALGSLGALWVVTVMLGGGQLAVALWAGAIGVTMLVVGGRRLRTLSATGGSPWQSLGGAGDAPGQVRAVQLGLALALAGLILTLWAVIVGLRWTAERAVMVVELARSGPTGLLLALVALIAGALVLLILLAAALTIWRARPRPVAPPAPGTAAPAGPNGPGGVHDVTVAAHLHDSVLQTLALIARTADDPNRVRQLARQQERSLRSWLAGREDATAATVAAALRLAAEEVEDEVAGVRVEVVAVGDRPLDGRGDALVRAAREAMRNAARHAGSPVRVFLEVSDARLELWVRDTGPGFDLAQVPEERRGVRDAIVGRMEHVGGTAALESGPQGTEIALSLPLDQSGATR